jgi:hypothetical protein
MRAQWRRGRWLSETPGVECAERLLSWVTRWGQIPRFPTIAGMPSLFVSIAIELGTCQYDHDRLNTSGC